MLFWKEYQNDVKPGKIFEKYGYPTEVLGSKRILGISRLIREQFYSEDDFQKRKRQPYLKSLRTHVNKSGKRGISVKELCEASGVSRSGYYAWLKASTVREESEENDRKDFEIILEAYKAREYKKGAEGIYMYLIHMDSPVIMNIKKFVGS